MDHKLIIKLYQDGKSLKQIAEHLNVGSNAVCRRLKKLGIQLRPWTTKGMKFPGRSVSDEVKAHLSAIKTGVSLSPEHRAKVIKTLRNGGGEKNGNWSGGRWVNENGYVKICLPGRGYVSEHRLVMEKTLGRRLKRSEHIHHIDENPSNNSIENLKLVSPSEHSKIHWGSPEMKKWQSERVKRLRQERFWSTKKTLRLFTH